MPMSSFRFALPLLSWLSLLGPGLPLQGRDLVLLEGGQSAYQIVLPDEAPSPGLDRDLAQTARLLQVALAANGAEVPVVRESQRDPSRPAIWLGNTNFARAQGLETSQLSDWSYRQYVVGADLILAGRDHPPQAPTANPRRPNWERVGTAKAVVDFAREFLGVRFLYPDLRGYEPLRQAEGIDLLNSPSLEFLPQERVVVPADLDRRREPLLRLNTAHPEGGSFYDLAHHRFPRVDRQFGSHTWERAVPAELYESHPEYFALVQGKRLDPKQSGNAQYCLSHPEVRERIYQDLADHFERGFESVDLGQPDGFQACQCESCADLYDTGEDWGEKIWLFHREVAERLHRSHPGREVTIMSYILTAMPPKGFTAFPANTGIMLTGSNEEDLASWANYEVPRGFTGYVYNWCPNLGTRYTPMRTPGFVERQVKRLAAAGITALLRDGPGQLFGLEGPVYYTMGRMFDDPEGLTARALVDEFCEGAFPQGNVRFHMRAFYDELYQAVAPYSDYFGTRSQGWTHRLYPSDARTRKSVNDPFALLTFLYPPAVLSRLEAHLQRAESLAPPAKVRERLALVRREFDYLKHLVGVAHLHQAWQIAPDPAARDRLLDAIEARNLYLERLFDPEEKATWGRRFFPFPGHSLEHLRLAYDGYQEPFARSCYNWDLQRMRQTPPTGPKRLRVARVEGPIDLEAPTWKTVPSQGMSPLPPLHDLPRESRVQVLCDAEALYVRFELELGEARSFPEPKGKAEMNPQEQESVELYLRPEASSALHYRFAQGPHPAWRYEALRGAIEEVMDPRYGRYDPTWKGEWTSSVRVDNERGRWLCLFRIPFATLGTEPPMPGVSWSVNFGRTLQLSRGRVDRASWSTSLQGGSGDEAEALGEIVFE